MLTLNLKGIMRSGKGQLDYKFREKKIISN